MKPEIDPFKKARQDSGVLKCEFEGEEIAMILRHADVRAAAKDWETFSSDAPFRVPIPSEEDVRSMRQLPIEVDPPEHGEYRALVEPFFKRSKTPEVIAQVEALIAELLGAAAAQDRVEIVNEFALPLQSRALTYLLNVPESEAEIWIRWGIHVFRVTGGIKKGTEFEDYLQARFDQAAAAPGEDLFSSLTQATYQGRPLTREEMMGFANLVFAGGRDTVIHTVSNVFAYLARNPAALPYLREDPKRITHASEEFFRVYMPLTHIGRVCPVDTEVHGTTVKSGDRVSLCWASANQDETVFDHPEEIRLDRKPNPHLSFGFGTHLCLGAIHARLLVRTLLQQCVDTVESITELESEDRIERESEYQRISAFESFVVKIRAKQPS